MTPDISMCGGITCPKREKCYRFMATPNKYRQTYFLNVPYDWTKATCDLFMEIEKEEKK